MVAADEKDSEEQRTHFPEIHIEPSKGDKSSSAMFVDEKSYIKASQPKPYTQTPQYGTVKSR